MLLHTSDKKLTQQDTKVIGGNIKLYSLGSATSKRSNRIAFIKKICKDVGSDYDCLLIRGITPRQLLVYQNCPTKFKAFLLVGSLLDSKPVFSLKRSDMILWAMHHYRMFELKKIAQNSLMMANSPHIVRELKDEFGIEAYFNPTNTIKHSDFNSNEFQIPGNNPELLFCGRVVKEKGIEELLIAIGILKKQAINCRLKVVGKVNSLYKSQLEKLAEENDIKTNIQFEGYIPFGERLLKYYKNAQLYVLPSLHEGFPHSIWESAANCTPIITTPVGGIPGLVSEKEVFFIKPKNPDSIVEVISTIINSSDSLAEKVQNTYELAGNYSVEKCAIITYKLLTNNTLSS